MIDPRVVRPPFIGGVVLAGIGAEEIGGGAVVVLIVAALIICVAIIFIWIRVNQLARDTTTLTDSVSKLTGKVDDLRAAMGPGR